MQLIEDLFDIEPDIYKGLKKIM